MSTGLLKLVTDGCSAGPVISIIGFVALVSLVTKGCEDSGPCDHHTDVNDRDECLNPGHEFYNGLDPAPRSFYNDAFTAPPPTGWYASTQKTHSSPFSSNSGNVYFSTTNPTDVVYRPIRTAPF